MTGTLHKKQPLYLHRRIGSCGTGHGEFEMLSVEPTGEPLVVHSDGRAWTLSWSQIAKMADEAFLADDQANENGPEQGV